MPEVGYSRERFTETIEVLRKLKEEGSIGWIATSSHKPRFLAELIRAYDCFDSVMIRYNYHLQEARDVIFPLCKAQEIGVVVMKPISWPYYGIPFTCFGPIGKEKNSLSPIQNSLKWILNSEQVSTVVPGMNNRKELEENVKAIEIDEKIDEKILNQYLETAQGPRSKEKLEKMLRDSSIDIRHFSKRALKKFSK